MGPTTVKGCLLVPTSFWLRIQEGADQLLVDPLKFKQSCMPYFLPSQILLHKMEGKCYLDAEKMVLSLCRIAAHNA